MPDDFTATTATTGTVAVDGSVTGEIESRGDQDWFAVTLEAGTRYRIDLEGAPTRAGTLRDPYLRGIYNSSGHQIRGTTNDDSGAGWNSRLYFTAAESGTHYVSAGDYGSATGTYRLSVMYVSPDDTLTGGTDTTGTVAVDGSVTGEIESRYDQDWFAVTLEAGTRYRIDLEGAPTRAGTLRDPYLRGIYNSSGNQIRGTTNDDSGAGLNSRLYFTATESGTHYVSAGDYGARTGTYRLSVMNVSPGDRLTAGTDTTGTVAVDGSVTGEIESRNDQDWFAVTLEAGTRYRIDLEGAPTHAGTLRDPYLRGIYNSSGNQIRGTTNDASGAGLNSRLYFTATESGTHYVSAGAYGSATGTYRLSVMNVSPDDTLTGGTDTTGTVAVDGSVTGEIGYDGDRDWFAVTLAAGTTYRIDLEGAWTGDGTLQDPHLHGIYDSNGNRIDGTTDRDAGTGLNSRVTFTATESGTHYVSAGDYGTRTGTYRLSVTDVTPADALTAGTVAVDGSVTGAINYDGDRDWFAVTLVAGTTYRIDLQGSPSGAGTLSNPYLRGIYDSNGNPIGGTTNDDGGAGRNSRVTFTATASGTHYVSAGADGGGTGTYRLSVTNVSADDAQTAGTDTTGTVAVDGSVTGAINYDGDRDWFAVTLVAGTTYRIDLQGSPSGAGTLSNPYLRGIYDSNGNPIGGTTNDDGGAGRNSRVTFTATASGTHYVSAGADGGATGTYRLSVTNVSADDAQTAGTDTTGTVAVDGSVTGAINHDGDRDWFAVTLVAGTTYRIDLQGSPSGAGTLSNPYLRGIYDSNGNPIGGTTNDNGGTGRNSRVTFTATESGTHYVSAGAYGSATGTYRLSVTNHPTDDALTAGTDTTGTVAVDGSVTGAIDHDGDRDWFAVTLEAGTAYRIDLQGSPSGAGTLSNPYLRGIYDSNGNPIGGTTNDNGGTGLNSRVTFTATQDDTYYVSAGAYGNATGTYRLSVTNVSADDALTAGTDTTGTVAVDGSVTGEIDYDGDRDWFAVTLEAGTAYRIDLEGSPSGAGTLGNPYLRGIYDSNGNPIGGTTNDNGGTNANSRVTFTATDSGTHYVSAGAYGSATGTYRLSVTNVSADDALTAGTDTTGTVAVDGSVTGEIDYDGDRDWFAVTLEAGTRYRIDLQGWITGAGTLWDPSLRGIYDSNGNPIPGATNDNGGNRVIFTATYSGTHYVSAGADGARADGSPTGTYRLSVTNLTALDPQTAGTDTTGTVAVDGSVTGAIASWTDRDWFAVTLVAGTRYRIDLEGARTGAGTLDDPYFRGIYDSNGNRIDGTTNDDAGTGFNSRVYFTATRDGTHYLSAGGHGYSTGTYRLSVTNLTAADAQTAGTDTTGTVAVDGSVTGEIEFQGDGDWFAVTLVADTIYRIDLEGLHTGAGTLLNPYLLGIYDSNGNRIGGTTDDNGGVGLNSRVFFTATEDDTYYVSAGAYGRATGTYRLSVTNLPIDDALTAGTDTTGTVAVGGSVTGEINYERERDWFAVTLVAGTTYRIDLQGSPSGDGTLSHPYLRGIYDSNGNRIPGTTNDNGSTRRNSRVTFTATQSDTHYVSAAGYADTTGTYRLSVTNISADDALTAGTDTTGTVAVDGSVTGEIDYDGDRDWFAVTLEAGTAYRIDLEGSPSGAGTLSNPYLRGIYDSNGNPIGGTTGDDGGTGLNSRVTFTATASGTHYVSAGANGSATGTYRLSVTNVTPNDAQTAGTDTTGTVAVDGSVTGEIDYDGDRDWFAVTLEAGTRYRIDLEGLHTGAGTLSNPYLRGIYDSNGNPIGGTTGDDGGTGRNSRVTFRATDSGTHYVSAGADGNATGTYRLSVTNTSPNDAQTAGTDTTGTVAVDGSVTGVIEHPDDRDWFAVTLSAGTTYSIDLEGSPSGAGTLSNPYLRGIYDSNGNPIGGTTDHNGGVGPNSLVTFTATDSGTHYVSAGAERGATGTYRLSVTNVTALDAQTAGTDTTGTVAVDGSVTAEIDYDGDRDWFAVTLVAGTTYRIDLEGSLYGDGTLSNPYLRGIYDSNGNPIGGTTDDNGGTGLNSRVTFRATDSGTHYVSAGAFGGTTGTYRLLVTNVTPNDAQDAQTAGTDTTGTVAVDGSVTAEIDSRGDQDWFAVTLVAGMTYRIDLEGAPSGDGTLGDSYLRGIYDSNGNRIPGTTNDDGGAGWNSRLHFTATESGTHYVSAGAFADRTGTYRLSVTNVTPDDAQDAQTGGTDTTGTVAVDGSVTAEIDSRGDQDWFAVTLVAGTRYRIDLEGSPTGAGSLRDPYLRGIYDSNGNRIPDTTDDDHGTGLNSRVTFTATDSGTHYVSAGSYRSATGTYELSVEDVL